MSTSGQRRLFFLFGIVPHVASAFAILVGMLVVVGWVFDVGVLKSVLPGLTAMKLNTAVALVLAGLALLGSQSGARPLLKKSALTCGGIVFLTGVLTLGEYFGGINLGIDELLVRDITNLPGDIPGRMALNTAASFTALGAALFLLNFERERLDLAVHGFAIVPILLGGAAFIGYTYDVEALLREHMNYTPMAMNASVAITLLGIGVVSARPGYPFRQFLGSGTAAGTIARRIFPMAILFVFAAGWLILRGYRAGYFRETVGLAIFAAAVMVSVGALILWSTGLIYDADSKRKRVDEELRSASQYTRSLIEASVDPLVTISAEGRITDVNEATVQATGIPRNRLVGTDFSEYFTEPEKARAGYREVFEKGEVRDYPLSIRHRDGRVMDVLYNASVYRNPAGEVAGVFAAARDITERKKAENEIRELNRTLERRVEERTTELEQANARLTRSTTFLENLIESIPGPMFYKDRQGIYLGGNEAFYSYIGLPREGVVGQTVYGISPKHLADMYKKADDELMERGGKQVYESRVRYADGTEHDVIFHKATYPNPDGSVGGLIGIILDISERKQHEQERERLLREVERRAAELDVANKDLEGFAYSVSHDLRVPLRAIDGFAHQLLTRYEGKLDEEGTRYLNIVRNNTRKMSQLIDDILAFSRMGRLGMSVTEINMMDLVNNVLDELKPALAGRDVQFEIGALPACHADRAMLRQVWVNLINNAIKFTRPRPSAHIEVGGYREGNKQAYYVKDNGVGFDMAYADKLFGVFQRLHGVEEFEGTGIGLAIVKRVIARHGGRVWAESKVNEGAAFYFSLPA